MVNCGKLHHVCNANTNNLIQPPLAVTVEHDRSWGRKRESLKRMSVRFPGNLIGTFGGQVVFRSVEDPIKSPGLLMISRQGMRGIGAREDRY